MDASQNVMLLSNLVMLASMQSKLKGKKEEAIFSRNLNYLQLPRLPPPACLSRLVSGLPQLRAPRLAVYRSPAHSQPAQRQPQPACCHTSSAYYKSLGSHRNNREIYILHQLVMRLKHLFEKRKKQLIETKRSRLSSC